MARYCATAFAIAAVVLSAGMHFHNQAAAQVPNDFMRMFGGMVQQAVRQAALAEWQKLPPNETSCLDEALKRQGSSIGTAIQNGIMPNDPRLSGIRFGCRVSTAPLSASIAGNVNIQNLSSKPTFDCSKARSLTARVVCLDQAGAAADWDLITAYWARYFSLPQGDRQAFDQAQQAWLDTLNQTCPKAQNQEQCVLAAYRKRAAGYRSQLEGDALAESHLTPEQHAKIQQSLIALGLLDDTPDGEFGSNTRSAIERFKAQHGGAEDGSEFLRADQLEQLMHDRSSPQPQRPSPPSTSASSPSTLPDQPKLNPPVPPIEPQISHEQTNAEMSPPPSAPTSLSNTLPACGPENALLAFKYQALGRGHLELVQFMIVDGVIPLGVNNIDGSKMCKATFRCDIEKAKEIEKEYYGPHVLTQTCFNVNQAYEAGNPNWLRYTIKPNGEGGTLITTLPN
jgi:uncharacterized protein